MIRRTKSKVRTPISNSMEMVFKTIGIEIPNKTAFHNLAENAERNGEASIAARAGRIVRGSCWRIGFGLEVWTTFNESETGEIFYSNCRPAFRARQTQILSDWSLSETKGEVAVEGCIEKSSTKILFRLQNLTEINSPILEQKTLKIGLCGLAYRAVTSTKREKLFRQTAEKSKTQRADWHLRGTIRAFDEIRNAFTNQDLSWLRLDAGDFDLEILVSRNVLQGGDLQIGKNVEADVWLQGHIAAPGNLNSSYEGIDRSQNPVDFWNEFRRAN